MTIELTESETSALREALTSYLSDLRAEIVKTEKYEFRQNLHEQEKLLNQVLKRLA